MLRSVLWLALLSCFVGPARAYDLDPSVYVLAQFPAASTDTFTFGDVLPGGGRAADFGQFGKGGALCSDYAGEYDWFCASASARVEIDRQVVATKSYVGTATAVRLKAQIHLDYRNGWDPLESTCRHASLSIL